MREINKHKLMSKVDWYKVWKFFKELGDNNYKKCKNFLRKYKLIPQKKVGDFGCIEDLKQDNPCRDFLQQFNGIDEFADWVEEELIKKRNYINNEGTE